MLEAVRAELAELRAAAAPHPQPLDETTLLAAITTRVAALAQPVLRRVFNLTGTVLHTKDRKSVV